MNSFEIAVLKTKIDNQHRTIEGLEYRLSKVETPTEEALCKLALKKEKNKLQKLEIEYQQGAV